MTSDTRVRQQWHAVESGDGGATIKSETGGYVGTIQWKGDAHDIVRAVNSHEELLAALEAADEWGDLIRQNYPEMRFPDQVRAAIKRARGED